MPKTFNRIIEFHIRGEIDDSKTTPESILKNYNWSFDDNVDGNIQLFAHHKDSRGRITEITRLPKIRKCNKLGKEYLNM